MYDPEFGGIKAEGYVDLQPAPDDPDSATLSGTAMPAVAWTSVQGKTV